MPVKLAPPPVSLRRPQTRLAPPTYEARQPLVRDPAFAQRPLKQADPRPDAFPDYARIYTPEGGIRFIYKDRDERLRVVLAKIALWSIATVTTFWFAYRVHPIHSSFLNYLAALIMAGLYAWIVWGPVEIYRSFEIRPDCFIIEDEDVFWRDGFQMGLPSFTSDAEGNRVFTGTYGTRHVEFFKVVKFDEFDRAPELLAVQISIAFQQLWRSPGA